MFNLNSGNFCFCTVKSDTPFCTYNQNLHMKWTSAPPSLEKPAMVSTSSENSIVLYSLCYYVNKIVRFPGTI